MTSPRKRALLRPPRDARLLRIWLASGPGRAWRWGRWARSKKPDSPLYEVAKDARKRLAEVARDYRAGRTDLANKLIERLSGELAGALAAERRRRSLGGKRRAIGLKEEAAERDLALKAAAEAIRADNPSLSYSRLAELLELRGFGSKDWIRKEKLPTLLPRKT